MYNPWRKLVDLNPETEIWWDTSPLIWPNFKEQFVNSPQVPIQHREWMKNEFDGMFFPAPVDQWLFKGCTTNPLLSWNVIKTRSKEWDTIIREKRSAYKGKSKYGFYLEVYFEVVKRGAEHFMPLFEASGGKFGHLSGQVDPQLIRNESAMIEMAEQLADLGPNIMIKIPGSSEGMPVIRHLASKGIATNATLVYTVSQIMTVARMVAEGRKQHLAENPEPRFGWRAVCTHMAGRTEDSHAMRGVVNRWNLDISPLDLRSVSEAIVKKCARLFEARDLPIKMLHCSQRPHCNAEGDCFYPHMEMFAGGPLVITVPGSVVGDYMTYYKDREIVSRWNDSVPEEHIRKLMEIPYFQRVYDEMGYDVEEFGEIPTLGETEVEFTAAAKEMIDYVGDYL